MTMLAWEGACAYQYGCSCGLPCRNPYRGAYAKQLGPWRRASFGFAFIKVIKGPFLGKE